MRERRAAQRSAERRRGEESSGTWRVRADRKSLGTWSITPQFSRLAASLRSTEPQRPAAHRSFAVAALPLLPPPPPPPIPARCTVLVHYSSPLPAPLRSGLTPNAEAQHVVSGQWAAHQSSQHILMKEAHTHAHSHTRMWPGCS